MKGNAWHQFMEIGTGFGIGKNEKTDLLKSPEAELALLAHFRAR